VISESVFYPSIIALLLGRLRLSAAEAVKVYEDLASAVFSTRKSKGKDGTFKATILEKEIKDVVAARLNGRADARMYEPDDSHACRVQVTPISTCALSLHSTKALFVLLGPQISLMPLIQPSSARMMSPETGSIIAVSGRRLVQLRPLRHSLNVSRLGHLGQLLTMLMPQLVLIIL